MTICRACGLTLRLHAIYRHLHVCEENKIKCRKCGDALHFRELAAHDKNSCKMRKEICRHCNLKISLKQKKKHRCVSKLTKMASLADKKYRDMKSCLDGRVKQIMDKISAY